MECFDYSYNLNVICTGGVDHAVRLWNPYVTVKPVAIMKGHQSSIIDLAIHEALEQVFSYDKDGVRHLTSRFLDNSYNKDGVRHLQAHPLMTLMIEMG